MNEATSTDRSNAAALAALLLVQLALGERLRGLEASG